MQRPFFEDEGVEAIVSAMTAHRNVLNLGEQGCRALGNLALYNDVNRVSIAAKHGVEAVVSAMAACSNIREVQEQGCLALGNLSCNNHANRVSIAAKPTHINVSKVQEFGCYALGIISCNDANNVSILAKNGIETIVNAMTAHSNVLKVQERGA
jgi:hypothetical protein